MSLETDVQNALMTQLTVPALSGNPPIAYPLVAYTPTPGVAYLEARPLLRAEPEHFGLPDDNVDIHRGVFQVDAVTPDGQGEAPGLLLAGLVVVRFAIGTKLTVGNRYLAIAARPAIGPVVKDAPWVRYPVSIRFRIIV